MKKILAIGIMLCFILLNVSVAQKEMAEKTISFGVEKKAVPIGGPLKAEAKKIEMALPLDIQVTSDDADEKYPTLATDKAGNMLMEFSYAKSLVEIDLAFAYSTDNGKTWELIGPVDPFEGEAELQTAIDFCRVEEGKSLAYGTFVTTAGNGGITPFIVFEDMKNPETWVIYYLDWTDDNFYGLESIDIACDEEIEGMDEDFVMTYIMSFPAFDNWPEVHSIPFILFHPEGDAYWCYWFYYNYSSHVRIDIDRPMDMIYLVFQTTNETNQDVVLEFAPESALGEWGDGKGEMGLFRVGGSADATNPDVSADNNNIYVVCQVNDKGNEDIVCFYSNDGGDTWGMSYIANSNDDELYPVVEASGNKATCLFYKNGDLYVATTEDGGATWSVLGTVNDVEGNVIGEYAFADISAGYAVWMDNRNGNADIFFDQATAVPILTIDITGGFGVTITISNVGTADAKNLNVAIDISGLVFIGKSKEMSIDEIKAGESVSLKMITFGLGPVTIKVTADGTTKEASGFMLGPLVLL